MRPRLSVRDRTYIACLAANVVALVFSARYWWHTGA